LLIVKHDEVDRILRARETDLIDLVRTAYELHDEGRSAVPHSTFLRFPADARNRIIGLPAFIGGEYPAAGMKWISSFPGNIDAGLARASSVVVLNELGTGRPVSLIEGSLVSAKRTAASAALAAREFGGPDLTGVSMIGCGPINFEVLRFLLAAIPAIAEVTVFDIAPARAAAFSRQVVEIAPDLPVTIATDIGRAVGAHQLVSIATTVSKPYLNLDAAKPGAIVLHVSLRDLTAETIVAAQNVVDDADHVCREGTSLHLAEQATGDRAFIDAPIGAVLRGRVKFTRDTGRPLVYSPFGLGALDVSMARFVHAEATRQGMGTAVVDFLPGTTT
jgi:2,3-diaminopropionate biosynthesis protein SbnB